MNSVKAPRILAAVVTYNRLALLQRCVAALKSQARAPDEILVVDNSSTDGTSEWLKSCPGIKVITQPNLGGAGGFYRAAKHGYELGYDWSWLMDDDTIPRPDALARLCASPAVARPDTGFVYSLQVYPDGSVPVNDPGPTSPNEWALSILEDRCMPVRRCSFVAFMVARSAIGRVGYPIKEMFFMGDDHEYSRRIIEAGYRGYCVLDSVVLHETKIPARFDSRSWNPTKKKYSNRNSVYLIRTSREAHLRKTWRLLRLFGAELLDLMIGRSSPSVICWAMRGLAFAPDIEKPGGGVNA